MVDAVDDMDDTDGATLLRVWIAERKASRAEVAALIETTPTTVSVLSRGHRRPGLDLALRIEKTTGIPVEAWRKWA